MFLLARELTGRPSAAFVGGILFGFNPNLWGNMLGGHLSFSWMAGLPLFVLFLRRLLAQLKVNGRPIADYAVGDWAVYTSPILDLPAGLTPGLYVSYDLRVLLPAALPPGRYQVVMGLYDSSTQLRLSLPGGSDDRLDLGEITVAAP